MQEASARVTLSVPRFKGCGKFAARMRLCDASLFISTSICHGILDKKDANCALSVCDLCDSRMRETLLVVKALSQC